MPKEDLKQAPVSDESEWDRDREILSLATREPWKVRVKFFNHAPSPDQEFCALVDWPQDAEVIERARTRWPAALDEIARLRSELQHVHECMCASENWARAALAGETFEDGAKIAHASALGAVIEYGADACHGTTLGETRTCPACTGVCALSSAIRKQRDRAVELLRELYGDHRNGCSLMCGGDRCTCGVAEIEEFIDQLDREKETSGRRT